MRERGAVEELDHPVAGHRAYVQLPLTFDGRPLRSTRPAPTFGQHTGEVLADWLGLAEDEISELRTAEVVGTVPRQPTRR
jgi:crotonobetainyl-CoA:carnitine CoA-transferase CaiB-like acyl-CoA transferase